LPALRGAARAGFLVPAAAAFLGPMLATLRGNAGTAARSGRKGKTAAATGSPVRRTRWDHR
jgi:hypothetical protein